MTINELRSKRAKLWEGTKAFLETHRKENGTLSAEDDATYTKMEQEITDLGREISRMERQEAIEREMNAPTAKPLTTKPDATGKADTKTGRASDAYKKAFWAQARSRNGVLPEVRDALQEGVDTEGGYLVPDEYEHTLVQGLEEGNIIRNHANVITTSSGSHKIPVVASKGSAAWIDEEGQYTESDDVFGQVQLDAHKVGTIIKVSQELLADSAFDLERYFTSEFTRRIGTKEEEAFLVGNAKGRHPWKAEVTEGDADVAADTITNWYKTVYEPSFAAV